MSLPLTLGGRRLSSSQLCYGPQSALYIYVLPHVCNNGKTYDEQNYVRSFSNMFGNKGIVENNFFFNYLIIGKISRKSPEYVVYTDRERMILLLNI